MEGVVRGCAFVDDARSDVCGAAAELKPTVIALNLRRRAMLTHNFDRISQGTLVCCICLAIVANAFAAA